MWNKRENEEKLVAGSLKYSILQGKSGQYGWTG